MTSIKAQQDDGDKARLKDLVAGTFVPTADAKIVMSEMLTVWRKLHVERDHMAAPKLPADGPFGGAGLGNDDVDPGGPIPDPSLELMITNYRPAYIEVVDDLGPRNKIKELPFVHNLPMDSATSIPFANRSRDVNSQPTYWVIQIVGAYEGDVGADNDPAPFDVAPQPPTYGVTPGAGNGLKDANGNLRTPEQGPCLVFTETIRDGLAEFGLPWLRPTPAEGALRVAFHESLHTFNILHGTLPGDDPPMTYEAFLSPAREMMTLTPALLAWLRSTEQPM